MTVYPPLFFFCSDLLLLLLPLCDCDWGREPECPVTRGLEVEVGHYKPSLLDMNVLHLTLCFHWSSSALLLQLHPLIPSPIPFSLPRQLPSSTFSLLPPLFPLLPSSVCFCSLDSLSVPTSILSLSNYSPSLSLLCLLDCKRETGESKERGRGKKGGGGIMLTN